MLSALDDVGRLSGLCLHSTFAVYEVRHYARGSCLPAMRLFPRQCSSSLGGEGV